MGASEIHSRVSNLVMEVREEAARRSLLVRNNIEKLNRISNVEDRVIQFKQNLLNARKSAGVTSDSLDIPGIEVAEINESFHRTHIRAKLYSPSGSKDLLPCIFHIHGGGLLVGGIDEEINRLASISLKLGCKIFDIEYRLAPEFKFPIPLNDCYYGFQYCSALAESLGINSEMLNIMGESAGGGLAASVVLRSIRENGPQIRNLFLMAPMLDHRNTTLSSAQYDGSWPFWPAYYNRMGWRGYLGSEKEISEFASPSIATDLEGFPETYIEVGFDEVFRDESVDFARKLINSNGRVDLHVYDGIFHGFEYAIPEADITQIILEHRYLKMKRMIHSKL